MIMMREPTSKFLKVICSKCNNEQIVFNKPSADVKCLVCDEILVEATGGKGKVKVKVEQVMG